MVTGSGRRHSRAGPSASAGRGSARLSVGVSCGGAAGPGKRALPGGLSMEDGFSSYSSLYDTSSLLQFCNDDSASAASSMEVTDRIASLEQKVQMQEDDIQLLKSALADVVRRLNITEEQQAVLNRKGPTKADLHCTKVNSRAQSKCLEAGACSRVFSRRQGGASLVVQWLRICLPMQGTRVRSLVWEDPTCCGATKPVRHNY
uniref:EMAP like 1 n=1 Tax=Balaenoptera musculus TaxID=9771 RepID=A0A8C0CCV2_BALMU